MRNKLILRVYLPASGETYEIRTSRGLRVKQVTDMLVSFLQGKGTGEYIPDNSAVLCDMKTGDELAEGAYIGETGILQGDKLMLI